MTTGEARYLSRAEAAEFLSKRGYKTAPATLAKRAVVGGGPPFVSWGRKPLYQPEALLEWAQRRCTGPRRSTSDRGGERLHADCLGDTELANSGNLERPTKIWAGNSPEDQKADRPPGTPRRQVEAGLDSERQQRRTKNAEKSSARNGHSPTGQGVSGEGR